MKLTTLRWMLTGFLVFWVVLMQMYPSDPVPVGFSVEWANGAYRAAGGTDARLLLIALVLFLGYWSLLAADPPRTGKCVGGIFRRLIAFWIDLFLAVFTVSPIVGIVPTLSEWSQTGVFQWTFERAIFAKRDAVEALILIPVVFAAVIIYFAVPLLRSRPTLGACIMGYQIITDEEVDIDFSAAVLRTILGLVAACAWFITPFVSRDRKRGKIWLDKIFRTRAVFFQ